MGILSAFGLLVFYSPIFLGWLTHDIPPIGDSDLLPSKISISEQDNGYFELIKALANFKSNETILQNQAALVFRYLPPQQSISYFHPTQKVTLLNFYSIRWFRYPEYNFDRF